jgi:hypothetical protein
VYWRQLAAAGATGLTSFNNLNGLPCSLNGASGSIVLSFAANGVATLTCSVSSATPPTLTAITITPQNAVILSGGVQQQQCVATATYNPSHHHDDFSHARQYDRDDYIDSDWDLRFLCSVIKKAAESLSLDVTASQSCLTSDKHKTAVQKDAAEARRWRSLLGVVRESLRR